MNFGELFDRVRMARAFARLAKDPYQTDEVFEIGDLGRKPRNRHLVRPSVERSLLDPGYLRMSEDRYLPPMPDLGALAGLPEGTLGRVYADHMLSNGLVPDFFRPFEITSEEDYFSYRMRATHDIWHAVTGYTTRVEDELALQGFTVAQIANGLSSSIISAFLINAAQNHPEHLEAVYEHFWNGYAMGRRAAFFAGMRWEERWEERIADVRRDLNVTPAQAIRLKTGGIYPGNTRAARAPRDPGAAPRSSSPARA